MQEQSVGWDPITICRTPPLYEKVFVLYCLINLGFAIVRSVRLARVLWFGGLLSRKREPLDAQFEYVRDLSKARLAGMKRLALFTLLLTFLVFAYGARSTLTAIRLEKSVGIAAVSGGLADVGTLVIMGGLIATVLYGVASLYDGVLARRRASWKLSRANATQVKPTELQS